MMQMKADTALSESLPTLISRTRSGHIEWSWMRGPDDEALGLKGVDRKREDLLIIIIGEDVSGLSLASYDIDDGDNPHAAFNAMVIAEYLPEDAQKSLFRLVEAAKSAAR